MAIYTLNKYALVWKQKLKQLKKSINKSSMDAATYMVAQAKSMAPYKSGETMNGIRKRQRSNGKWVVESKVSGRFKQNLFANQTAPFRKLNFKSTSKQPFFEVPQEVVYGNPTYTPSGNAVRWTGVPRFFHFATVRTSDRFKKLVRENTRKALMVKI